MLLQDGLHLRHVPGQFAGCFAAGCGDKCPRSAKRHQNERNGQEREPAFGFAQRPDYDE